MSNQHRILIVDDDQKIRNLLEDSLSSRGYAVTCAASGAEALWILLQDKPDLMILDLLMPEMPGEHVCRVVKNDPALSDIIVLILSARNDLETKLNCFQIGAEEYLTKPISMEELCARVAGFLKFAERSKKSKPDRERTITIRPTATQPKPKEPDVYVHKPKYGTYKIERLVGKGGMGLVYKAYDEQLDRFVALKILSERWTNSAEFVERFRREARIIATLNHPGIAQIYSLGQEERESYFALLWCPGGSLRDLLRDRYTVHLLPAIDIVLQCSQALAAASLKGVVHRDIKPSNIMFDENRQIKLVDFGIAHTEQSSSKTTSANEILGSPAYMAPEQARADKVDHRTDIYSLGITFFQLLCGELPFSGASPLDWAIKHATADFPGFASVENRMPLRIYEIIARMTAKNPDERYQSYTDLIHDLETIQKELFRLCQWKIPFARNISEKPQLMEENLPAALLKISQQSMTGILTARWNELQKKFYIVDGEAVLFESPQQDESVWQWLQKKGILQPEQLPEKDQPLEESVNRLLFLQSMQLEDFKSTYRELMKNAFLQIFRWPVVEVDLRSAEIIEDSFCRIRLTSIYMEGILSFLDFDSIRRFVPRDLVIRRTPQFDRIMASIELSVQENFLASRIDGVVTVETLQLLTGFPEEKIMRFLFAMKGLGGIDYAAFERIRQQRATPEPPTPEPQPIETAAPPIPRRRSVPRAAESFFRLATQAYQKGDYWSVRRLCSQAIELNADEGKYHHLEALALAQRSETNQLAENSFRKAIELDSINIDFRIDFANYLKQQGRIAEALKECESIDPENPKVAAMLLSLKRMLI